MHNTFEQTNPLCEAQNDMYNKHNNKHSQKTFCLLTKQQHTWHLLTEADLNWPHTKAWIIRKVAHKLHKLDTAPTVTFR